MPARRRESAVVLGVLVDDVMRHRFEGRLAAVERITELVWAHDADHLAGILAVRALSRNERVDLAR